jgi:hypothetical protein
MILPSPPDRWDIDRLTEERTEAVGALGFTLRQARFLVVVLIHSGVFVERQYRRAAPRSGVSSAPQAAVRRDPARG